MGKLVRTLSKDGSVMACAIDATDIVSEIERIHQTSAVVSAAMGRLSAAASMMGCMLKASDQSLTLRMKGSGPIGSMIAVADNYGNVKCYAENTVVELPLNQYGKLDVSGAVGKEGFLQVIKDLGMKEPYTGQVPIVSGEIAEDITQYFAISEQTPTVCGLGVLVNPDLTIKGAGGYIVQLLPFADESCIDILEENLKKMPPVSSMFAEKTPPEEVCFKLLEGLEPNLLDESNPIYRCDCNEERVERALISLGKQELDSMIHEGKIIEVACHFCNRKYHFSPEKLILIRDQAKA